MAIFPANSAMSFQIRTATLQDLGQLADLLTAGFYCNTGWIRLIYPLLRFGIHEDLKTRLNGYITQYACLAAARSVQTAPWTFSQTGSKPDLDELVGTVEMSCRPTYVWLFNQPRYLYLSNLAVDPRFRRQGVARQLLQACEQLALEWGFQDLYLHVMENNNQARNLYHKAGFRLQSVEWSLSANVFGQPKRLLMHKPLTVTRLPQSLQIPDFSDPV